jgi:hypothetical protein
VLRTVEQMSGVIAGLIGFEHGGVGGSLSMIVGKIPRQG